tara:strand:+ start:211 stop:1053 length:843 start_codon:yes stop_codon:yes gene_type:complete
MGFNSEINTGVEVNDGLGDGLRTNMRKLIENDNHLLGKNEWEKTASNNLKNKTPSKIAVNKEEPEAAFDVANVPNIETPLTGTFSYNEQQQLLGIGSLLNTELDYSKKYKMPNGDIVGGGYFFVSDKYNGYYFGTHPTFTDETIYEVVVNPILLNLFDLLKIEKTGYDSRQIIKLGADTEVARDSIANKVSGKNIYNRIDLKTESGVFSTSLLCLGQQKFQVIFTKRAGLFTLEVFTTGERPRKFSINENGKIILQGIQTSAPQYSNELYKDTNGFIKIG